jgi:hypothetical protein
MKSEKLVFPYANNKITGTTWRSSWILEYESPWSIIQKFCHFNSITFRDFLFKVGSDHVRILKGKIGQNHKSAYTLSGLSEELVQSILSYPLKEMNNKFINKILLPLQYKDNFSHNYLSGKLRFCPLCIQEKYHSTLHQFKFVNNCPIHNIKLLTNCPKCNQDYPYILEVTNLSLDYKCNCGFKLSSDQANRFPSKKFNPIIKSKDLIRWFSLSEHEVQKVRDSIIFNECLVSNDNEEESFKYDLNFLIKSLAPKYVTATLGENHVNLENKIVRERRREEKWIHSIHTYENCFSKKDLVDLHEVADKICSSIARKIRKTLLKSHRGCIVELTRHRKELSDHEVCPLAIAYTLWRARLQRFKGYKDVDNEGSPPFFRDYIDQYGFPVEQYNFSRYLSHLEHGDIFPKSKSLTKISYSWITLHFVSELIFAEFYRSLEYAFNWRSHKGEKYTVNSIYSLKYFPLLIIRKEGREYKKIRKDTQELSTLLAKFKNDCNCPNFSERERRKRKKARGEYKKSNPIKEAIDNM